MVRFTIRDVLWLTALVGLSIGWHLDHRWQVAHTYDARVWKFRAESLKDFINKTDLRTVVWDKDPFGVDRCGVGGELRDGKFDGKNYYLRD